jgi:hypothetical protein
LRARLAPLVVCVASTGRGLEEGLDLVDPVIRVAVADLDERARVRRVEEQVDS